ncbi:MAG: hypothetical protein P8X43_09705 [Maritimibacter sp.]|jgi:uncharacterized membrane protein
MSLAHIHPMILHFPIVLAYLLVMIDAIALWRGISLTSGTYAKFSLATAVLAGLSASLTAMFGDLALDIALENGVPDAVMEMHEGLGAVTATGLAIWAGLRLLVSWRQLALEGSRKGIVVLVELAFVVLITFTAYHGGNLVYDQAVNVASALN